MKNYLTSILLFFNCSIIFCQGVIPLNNKNENGNFMFDSIITKLGNKRIICLGEERHRIETFSKCKTEFVKYLHKNLGYEVVAFEGSLLNIATAFYNIPSDTLALKTALYGVWQTKSVLDLFRYSKGVAHQTPPLVFTGFDVKSPPSHFASLWLKTILQPINAKYAETVYSTDTLFTRKARPFDKNDNKTQPISKNESQFFRTFYKSLLDTITFYENTLLQKNSVTANQLKIIEQSILNRVSLSLLVTISETSYKQTSTFRDSIMTQNILWLVNNLYKDKKIILWAHDAHISKKTIKGYLNFNQKSSVAMLPNNIKNEVETISLNFIKNAPKNIKKQIKSLKGNTFFVTKPDYMNGEFEHVIYFKKTESVDKYKIK